MTSFDCPRWLKKSNIAVMQIAQKSLADVVSVVMVAVHADAAVALCFRFSDGRVVIAVLLLGCGGNSVLFGELLQPVNNFVRRPRLTYFPSRQIAYGWLRASDRKSNLRLRQTGFL
ncbi:hypothetical protein ACFQAT_08000 [Undibacterium arcticum]|uniref:Uncharacterized protein n=1 Tax=Undibacterium arcticum TaxID=1762892 RepID=A0ABV7EXD4_9BURK